jgi:tripartite-type tricarboxylate transporter receptor subunit TctC
MRRAVWATLLAIVAGALFGRPGLAQDAYPSRLVRLVVPALAGSTTDILARIVADQLTQKWGKPAIVENIAGGGMNVGGEHVARAAPDGHTLLVGPPAPIAINHMLYRDLGYNPKDFVAIALLAKIPNVLVVRNTLDVSSVKELVAYAKANPDKVTYATQGAGSTAHLTAAQLELLAGIKLVHVPYRGAQPALNDIVAGHVDIFFDTLTTSVPLQQAGKLKILAVAGPQRSAALPGVPTMDEAGLPGFRSITWFGLVAPPQTPAALAKRLIAEIIEILQRHEVNERLRELRLEPGGGSPADAAKFFTDETRLWGTVIQEANVQPQ